MAQSSFSLATSLTERKEAFLDRLSKAPDDDSPFIIIMGNEAADTDSLASSILLSHLLSTSSFKDKKFPPSTIYLPLAQLPRADMKLRAENEMLLSILQVDASSLLFLDDVPNLDKLLRSDIFLGLTDHPQLSTLWQPYDKFENKVEVIVDHHADSKSHMEAKLRVLKGPENGAVASAVSVVVDLFKDTKEIEELPQQLADLGLAAILIDTDNLRRAPRGKATSVDLEAAHALLKQSSFNLTTRDSFIQAAIKVGGEIAAEAVGKLPGKQDEMSIESFDLMSPKATLEAASSYYRILAAMKQNVTRLGTIDLLRRDYKEQTVHISNGNGASDIRAGFSSVPVGLSDWIHERHSKDQWNGFWKEITNWMKQKSLDVAVIGTSFREQTHEDKGIHKRELILAYKQQPSAPALFSSLIKHLESESYAAENQGNVNLYLSLEQPWKGWRRSEETGKKERVGGLDKNGSWTGDDNVKVAVWLQRNGRASRKVYLPAIVHALKKAATKGK